MPAFAARFPDRARAERPYSVGGQSRSGVSCFSRWDGVSRWLQRKGVAQMIRVRGRTAALGGKTSQPALRRIVKVDAASVDRDSKGSRWACTTATCMPTICARPSI